MHIDLPAEQQTFIENLVACGRFSSQNDAICEAVRLLISREQLKQKTQVGIEQAILHVCRPTGLGGNPHLHRKGQARCGA
jgi:putative addiction module CopG family antidote